MTVLLVAATGGGKSLTYPLAGVHPDFREGRTTDLEEGRLTVLSGAVGHRTLTRGGRGRRPPGHRRLTASGAYDPPVPPTSGPLVGVLALQGDVREHLRTLGDLGVPSVGVRRPAELAAVDALVLPGGESTTMIRLARTFGLLEPLRARVRAGLPVLGTCAGMILLADRVRDGAAGQVTVGGLDVTVRRNAFGRQVDSFEDDLEVAGVADPVHAVFIRAPWVEEVGPGVEVLARVAAGPAAGRIVAVRQGPLMATSFHPEVGGDARVHGLFLQIVGTS